MRYYILFLVFSLYISITLLEGLVILGLIYLFWSIIKSVKPQRGKLGIPIILYTLPTLLSTAIFYPQRINKAIEEGLFQFIYFLKLSKNDVVLLLRDIIYIFILGFFLLLPSAIYTFYKYGEPKPIWGGTFETGFFFTLFGLTFLILFFQKKGKIKFLLLMGFLISFSLVVLSHRRSMIMAFVVLFLTILLIFYRNKLIKGKILVFFITVFLIIGSAGYIYLSKTDHRFKTLNEVILGKRPLNERTLNIISSGRYAIFKEGLVVLKKDLKKGEILPLLIGHGVRAKEYLSPKSPIRQPRYESFFIFSEFIERGLIGVIGILLIYFVYLREIFRFRITEKMDFYRLIAILPLGIHLIQTLFTYFWDAMLPVFFILFKVYEISKEQK